MSFLAPLFLLGAIAVAAPIILHLIRRTSRQHIPFSSLMFLTSTPPRVTRKSRVENLLLLLLRCAVIALLALAFARPFRKQPTAPAIASLKRSVLLVDVSASMKREGLWAETKRRAIQIARDAGPSEELALVSFDGSARTLLSFEEWRRNPPDGRAGLVRQRMDSVDPGWGGANLGHAVVGAAELIASEGRGERGEILVLSDMAEGTQLEALQGFAWPKHISVSVVALRTKQVSNAGIQILPEEGDGWAQTAGKTSVVRARVYNSSESQRDHFEVRWSGISTSRLNVYVPPGQTRTVELQRPSSSDRLILSGDDADYDNVATYVPPQRAPVNVLFVGADAPTDTHKLFFYLQRAIQRTAGDHVIVTNTSPAGPIASSNVALYVVTDSSPETAAAIGAAVRDGATALIPLTSPDQGRLLAAVANTSVTAEEANSTRYAMFGEIDFAHPLFSAFADPRFSDFTKIHFWKYRRVGFEPSQQARVLARFDNGDPAVAQFTSGKGSVFMLASGWQPADSQLALSSKFVPLLFSMLEFSGTSSARNLAYSVGDRISLDDTLAKSSVTVRTLQGAQRRLSNMPAYASEPGIYSIEQSANSMSFAVNVPAQESRTAPIAIENLSSLGVPLSSMPLGKGTIAESNAAKLRAAEVESRQKLWRWLITVVLVVLAVETLVAGRSSRRTGVEVGT